MEVKHYIIIGNRKYAYILRPARKKTTIVCEEANIKQQVENERLPELLAMLPQMIISALQEAQRQSEVLRFRVTPEEKIRIMENAIKEGYDSVSAYIRSKVL